MNKIEYISFCTISESHDNITISYSIHFIDIISLTKFIEFSKEISQHGYYTFRSLSMRIFGESFDISKEESHIIKLIYKVTFVINGTVLHFKIRMHR